MKLPRGVRKAPLSWLLIAIVVVLVSSACTGSTDDHGTSTSTTDAPVLGQELVANGDFEAVGTSPDGWELTSYESDQVAEWLNDDERGRVLYMAAPVVADVGWPQLVSTEDFTVQPGTRYRLAVSARTDDLGLLFMTVAFKDGSGSEISGLGPGSPAFDSPDWTEFVFDFEPPAGAASAYVILRLALNQAITDASNLSIHVDGVSIRPIEG